METKEKLINETIETEEKISAEKIKSFIAELCGNTVKHTISDKEMRKRHEEELIYLMEGLDLSWLKQPQINYILKLNKSDFSNNVTECVRNILSALSDLKNLSRE